MDEYRILSIKENPQLVERASEWFSSKFGIDKAEYISSMKHCVSGLRAVPQWYIAVCGDEIAGGLGVIENDFHERKDLSPNVCAVFVEPEQRRKGLACRLLDHVCASMSEMGVDTLYLLTDHASFYERYGWEYLCMAQCDGGEQSRVYRHCFAPNIETKFTLAKADELPEIQTMFRNIIDKMENDGLDIFDDIYPCSYFINDINNKELYLLRQSGEPAAVLAISETNEDSEKAKWSDASAKVLYIERFGVNPQLQRKGMGIKALEYSKECARKRGAEYLRLFVVDFNTPAIRLYNKAGFTKVEGCSIIDFGDRVLKMLPLELKLR